MSQIKILLVEDNPGDARLIEELIRETGKTEAAITDVGSLATALSVLKDSTFDVVLLDLSLPDSQGLATFTCVQEHASGTPIILLTGLDDETLAVKAMQQGAQDYLVKGKVEAELLVRAIRYAIERQRLLVEMEKAREFEQHLAYHDVLTNLPNRLLFYDRLAQALTHAKRYSGKLAVFFLDLDGFKELNDSRGHTVGDRLLQIVAQRLKSKLRESDTIARLGGDEFTILLKGINNADDVSRAAVKILELLSEPYLVNDYAVTMSCSIGVSVFPFDGEDAESLIKKADFAMYRAKKQSKGSFQLYNLSMDVTTFKKMSIENSLRTAIAENEFELHFQPQLSLKTGLVTGIESLVRWRHPKLGLVYPGDFIPLAEETGLIVPIGEWVLRSACGQLGIWHKAGFNQLPVAVNLSARQFREISLIETVAGALEDSAIEPGGLVLEITETNAMQDLDYTISTLEVLKEIGVQIALDDFGTGYSSLSYLKRLPIDLLKIDKSFVKDVAKNMDDGAIVSAIVALSKSLGMTVIAEGVETRDQLEFLKSVHCDCMQGFFFSEPVSGEELPQFLSSNGVPAGVSSDVTVAEV